MQTLLRTGLGFDVHTFAKSKKPLILAGIKIASDLSLEAVSDGDVVLHAASDAICGACCLGDIGDYFDPQDKKSKGISSKEIVRTIFKKIRAGFEIVNMDITIIAQKPRLVSYKKQMLKTLRALFATSEVNVKIKSKEGLDILGGRNAIACFVSVLVKETIR